MATYTKKSNTKSALLSCGQGLAAVFPGNDQNQPIIPSPSSARLGQVTINTKGICRPIVEIQFSSIVNLVAPSNEFAKAALNFQLFRVCDDENPVLVNSWLYEVFRIENDNDPIRLSTSFSFTFCEELDYTKSCDYFVEVSVGGLQFIETISVNNVQIAAFTGESGILLSCGQSVNGSFVNNEMPSITIGRVIIDTREICRPTVSIEFSSVITYLQTGLRTILNVNLGPEANLKFSLFRVCDDEKPVLLNSWTYGLYRVGIDVDNDTRLVDSFNFNFCDDTASSNCCEYFVEVSVENLINAFILVDNVHITALAA